MKLKETTLDQRLFAGVICVIVLVYGFMVLGQLTSRVREFCGGITADFEVASLSIYVVLATLGAGLSILHLLSAKFRK